MRHAARCAVAAALLASGSCSIFAPSPLSVTEIFERPDGHRVPVIVVPGVVGSILGDSKTGAVGWVRTAEAFLLAHSTNLALPGEDGSDPDRLTSLGILERVQVVPGLLSFQQFEPVLDVLRQSGYTLGSCDFPRSDEDAFVFHFDFRRDAVDTVKQLARAIERVRSTRKDPTEKVALLTQSYGGLIARYYLMYGDRDVLAEDAPAPSGAGVSDVSHVAFFGTPHTGALVLFQILREGYVVGLNGSVMSPEVMSTFPSAYQVLPHPSENVFVDLSMHPYLDPTGRPLSLYDAATWVKLGWIGKARQTDANMARLERYLHRAKQWWNALEQPWSPPPSVSFLSVVGGTHPTPNRAIVNLEETGELSVSFEAPSGTPNRDRVNRIGPVRVAGDGRVTIESALSFPHGGRMFTEEEHDLIHQDPAVLRNVLLFLVHLNPRENPALADPNAVSSRPREPENPASRPAPIPK